MKSLEDFNSTDNITIVAKAGKIINANVPVLVLKDGIIVEELIEDSNPVEFNQSIYSIDPS